MKKLGMMFLAGMCLLSSCGISTSYVNNNVTAVTHVQLSQNNFRVLGRVSGSTRNWYLLGFGGLLSKNLYGEAKSNMMNQADLKGGARAIVDVTYDSHVRTAVVFSDYTVTATGTLIEFTDPNSSPKNMAGNYGDAHETPRAARSKNIQNETVETDDEEYVVAPSESETIHKVNLPRRKVRIQ